MNIYLERTFATQEGRRDIARRLDRWAEKYDWVCTRSGAGHWQFTRGSALQAIYTFDIRKVPTVATVTLTTGSPQQEDSIQAGLQLRVESDSSAELHCSMHVRSFLQIETPGDHKRVQEQLDVLIGHLKGAFED